MILINVKFPVRPERVEEWEELSAEYSRCVNAEEGCVFFELSRSIDEPNTYVCVEGFRDADAGAAHTKTEHFAWFVEKAPDLVSANPKIIYVEAPQVDGWGAMGEISPR